MNRKRDGFYTLEHLVSANGSPEPINNNTMLHVAFSADGSLRIPRRGHTTPASIASPIASALQQFAPQCNIKPENGRIVCIESYHKHMLHTLYLVWCQSARCYSWQTESMVFKHCIGCPGCQEHLSGTFALRASCEALRGWVSRVLEDSYPTGCRTTSIRRYPVFSNTHCVLILVIKCIIRISDN